MATTDNYSGMDYFRKAWEWWTEELTGLLPVRVRNFFSVSSSVLQVHCDGAQTRFKLETSSGSELIGEMGSINTEDLEVDKIKKSISDACAVSPKVDLILPLSNLLVRKVSLPSAVEKTLNSVIKFEIDKLTPFSKADVFYGYRPLGSHPEENKLSVEIYACRRSDLQGVLQILDKLDLRCSAIYPEGDVHAADAETLNLLPNSKRARLEPIWNREAKLTALGCVIILAACLAIPAAYLEERISRLDEDIEAVQRQANSVAEKRGLVVNHALAQKSIAARKNYESGTLGIINELTNLIPDNTWVSRLRLEDGRIVIQGESERASDLIETLEKSDLFESVGFRSSITRNPRTTLERYELEMQLTGRNS